MTKFVVEPNPDWPSTSTGRREMRWCVYQVEDTGERVKLARQFRLQTAAERYARDRQLAFDRSHW